MYTPGKKAETLQNSASSTQSKKILQHLLLNKS